MSKKAVATCVRVLLGVHKYIYTLYTYIHISTLQTPIGQREFGKLWKKAIATYIYVLLGLYAYTYIHYICLYIPYVYVYKYTADTNRAT